MAFLLCLFKCNGVDRDRDVNCDDISQGSRDIVASFRDTFLLFRDTVASCSDASQRSSDTVASCGSIFLWCRDVVASYRDTFLLFRDTVASCSDISQRSSDTVASCVIKNRGSNCAYINPGIMVMPGFDGIVFLDDISLLIVETTTSQKFADNRCWWNFNGLNGFEITKEVQQAFCFGIFRLIGLYL